MGEECEPQLTSPHGLPSHDHCNGNYTAPAQHSYPACDCVTGLAQEGGRGAGNETLYSTEAGQAGGSETVHNLQAERSLYTHVPLPTGWRGIKERARVRRVRML